MPSDVVCSGSPKIVLTYPCTQNINSLNISRPLSLATATVRSEMAPSARRSRRQSVRNESELTSLLSDTSESPPRKTITPYDAYDRRNADENTLTSLSSGRTRTILRLRFRNGSHGSRVSLLAEPSDHHDAEKSVKRTRQKRKVFEQEAMRLNWMRRLRPKPHRRF